MILSISVIIIGTIVGNLLAHYFYKKLFIKKKKAMTVKELKMLLATMDENQEVRFADYEDDEDEVTQFLPIHGVEKIKYKNKKIVCLYYNPDDDGINKPVPSQSMSLN